MPLGDELLLFAELVDDTELLDEAELVDEPELVDEDELADEAELADDAELIDEALESELWLLEETLLLLLEQGPNSILTRTWAGVPS
jgi:hypothetical protein